jgi:hypothetical protein
MTIRGEVIDENARLQTESIKALHKLLAAPNDPFFRDERIEDYARELLTYFSASATRFVCALLRIASTKTHKALAKVRSRRKLRKVGNDVKVGMSDAFSSFIVFHP